MGRSIFTDNLKVKMNAKANHGFTLMEMLLVMAIIAIIASVFFVNVFSSLARGRDSRRKQDLNAISQSLELYNNDNNRYPDPPLPSSGLSFSHPFDSGVIYLNTMPGDPKDGSDYCYDSTWGDSFVLYANLENSADPDLLPVEATCGGNQFNYGISSSNISL